MTLQQKPSEVIKYQGKEYPFHPYYNRVLTILSEVFPNDLLTDVEKVETTIKALSEAPICQDVFELILLELFPKKKNQQESDKTMDFEQDAGLIYAGFLQTYGIDLYMERNKMDWRIFTALVRGLPEQTEFSRVVKLRCTKVPKRTKNNSEYVDSLIEAKRAVALKEPEADRKKKMAQKWMKVAEGLMNVRR